ncbi:MAG: hypothetical protein R2932_46185, partial [Caldilineaceae bacterium]
RESSDFDETESNYFMTNTAVQQPKVVVIGADGLFFGRQAVWQMVHSPHLNNGTLALVDTPTASGLSR